MSGWVSWRISPNDPDQTNGDFNYELCVGYSQGETAQCPGSNMTGDPIVGRAGWLTDNVAYGAFERFGSDESLAVAVRAWNVTSGQVSTIGCVSVMNTTGQVYSSAGGHFLTGEPGRAWNQCGDAGLASVPGIAVQFTARPFTKTEPGCCGTYEAEAVNFTLAFRASSDEPVSGAADYRYCLRLTTTQFAGAEQSTLNDQPFFHGSSNTLYDLRTGKPCGQPYLQNHTTADGDPGFVEYLIIDNYRPNTVYGFGVRGWDAQTGQLADMSCIASITVESNTQGLCGQNPALDFVTIVAPGISGGPRFPLVPITDVAVALEINTVDLGYVFGALLVGAFVAAGVVIIGAPGAMTGGSVGMVLAAVFSLWPLWTLIFAFMLFALMASMAYAERR